jgi:lipopolysaccharide export system permease protein
MTLSLYIARLFLARFAIILGILASLLQIVDLLDDAGAALQRGGTAALLTYAALRFPSIVDQLVPISVLLAAALTLLALVQSNEMVAMRTIGVTRYRIVANLGAVAIVIAAIHFAIGDQIAPRTERKFKDWWGADSGETMQGTRLWLREGTTVIGIDQVRNGGQDLQGVRLLLRDDEGRLQQLIVAERAEVRDGWHLVSARRFDVVPDVHRSEIIASMPWDTRFAPADFAALLDPAERLSVAHLRGILQGTSAALRGRTFYEARLHRKFAFPAASLVMVLLAAPAAHGSRRGGTALYGLALGIVAGLIYLFVDTFMLAAGQAGLLPPSLAVWAPAALFASLGGYALLRLEG